MVVFAIDPGNEQSAYSIMDDQYNLIEFAKLPNRECMAVLLKRLNETNKPTNVVIERMLNYSTQVGRTTFETCEWIGRFSQEAEKYSDVSYLNRKDEKMYMCGTMNANDTSIRHALIDRFAKHDFRTGKGTAKNKDYFYGVKADCWSAICIAVTFLDMQKEKKHVEEN